MIIVLFVTVFCVDVVMKCVSLVVSYFFHFLFDSLKIFFDNLLETRLRPLGFSMLASGATVGISVLRKCSYDQTNLFAGCPRIR